MIEFVVEPTFEDYTAANRLMRRKAWALPKIFRPALSFAVFATAGTFLVGTSAGELWQSQLPVSLAVGIGGAAVWLLLCYGLGELRFGRQVRKTFDQIGTVELPTTYQLDQKGMQADYAEGSSRHEWARLMDYVADDRVLLLRRSDMMFFLIPTGQLPREQLCSLMDLLGATGLKRG